MEASVLRLCTVLVAALLMAPFGAGLLAAEDRSPDLRLPPDATYRGAEGSPGPVVFSHATHVPFAGNRCVACHPKLFSILQPTRRISHEEMHAGKQCGACHDGTKASGIQEDCGHCHKMEGGS
jgi:c(7)-type cytochrome triheme protein